jgi:hypothetical protein
LLLERDPIKWTHFSEKIEFTNVTAGSILSERLQEIHTIVSALLYGQKMRKFHIICRRVLKIFVFWPYDLNSGCEAQSIKSLGGVPFSPCAARNTRL